MFIVKLDSEGKVVWAKGAGGISTKNLGPGGYKVALDVQENLIVLGKVSGWGDKTKADDKNGIAFLDGEKLEVSVMGACILVKISPDGTTEWIKQSTGLPTLTQLAQDGDGNIYGRKCHSPWGMGRCEYNIKWNQRYGDGEIE